MKAHNSQTDKLNRIQQLRPNYLLENFHYSFCGAAVGRLPYAVGRLPV